MEVFLYNSTVCRLCGEENDSGSLLYANEENNESLSELINRYFPIKVSDDGELPRTICPGCTIQVEATVEFLNLIINGQKIIRELYQREREYKKNVLNTSTEGVVTEKIIYEIKTSEGVYQVEHPISLQVAGLDKPKRKRGRPPKKPKTPEELAEEAVAREKELQEKIQVKEDEVTGKRRRKAPFRFREVVQGKELERIFKEEGMTDGEESDGESKKDKDPDAKVPNKEPEVIGHLETSGELVVVVRGKGRGRPKGRMRPTREECAICGMTFSCVGRYMSHVAQHGPVRYKCAQCDEVYDMLLAVQQHQKDTGHSGQKVLPCEVEHSETQPENVEAPKSTTQEDDVGTFATMPLPMESMPELDIKSEINTNDFIRSLVNDSEGKADGAVNNDDPLSEKPEEALLEIGPKGKVKVKCSHCEKTFNSRQSKSLHIKAVHLGERPYTCKECGQKFGYPRSLALHTLSHRRHRAPPNRYACDLCGKVLNHPSSVVYHKQAEHANQRYVCSSCGKQFKHRQLLARHQLVHSQDRPYSCKLCDASFKTKANLLNHQLLHSGVKKYSCEICKHKFAHKTSLTLHMRWHTGSKPYTCGVCNKSFSQKGNLSEHERIHTGVKPYACSVCPRRFTTSSQCRLHARRHAQPERAYSCAHCPKRFASRSSWMAHQKREAGQKPFQCVECGRGFIERWALLKHNRKHTGERPFLCPYCPRAFADCSNLNKHKKHVHKQISLLVNEKVEELSSGEQLVLTPQQIEEISQTTAVEDKEQNANTTELENVNMLEIASEEDDDDERVIYVAYDVDNGETAYQILSAEEVAASEDKMISLFEENSVLQLADPVSPQHISVTDEAGNPIALTMSDGTQLTLADGRALTVLQDNAHHYDLVQTQESEDDVTEAQIVDIQKEDGTLEDDSSPVYYTIV